MSHYGITATHWNGVLHEVDEVRLHKIVQQAPDKFVLAPGELVWCSDVAFLIDGGNTVWVIASDDRGKYKNTERVRVTTGEGGRKTLYSCTKNGTPTSALTDLPRYLEGDDALPQAVGALLPQPVSGTADPYPTLTQSLEEFDVRAGTGTERR